MRPSWQMRRISVLKSPTAAPSKSETSSIKTHPPTANAWPPISSRAYQRVPSPKSLAWAGPYASGRTPSWPTSIPAEPATAPQKPSTDTSNTYAAPPSGSVTSPTTSPAASSKPADSDPNYTPNYEEPQNQTRPTHTMTTCIRSSAPLTHSLHLA